MLLCAVLLHGGCGSRTTEETEKVDTTENFDLIGTEGWEYQGEKKQYIYGEWTVIGVRKGDTRGIADIIEDKNHKRISR